jgi:methionyl-tRNA formyltransferase
VLTQPDRPAGRGMRSSESPVKRLASSRGIKVLQPSSLRDEPVIDQLRAARADVMVVAAYGQLLPPAALECAAHGAVNIHASLLPRWRGAAPIQRALLAGDRETGVSIMRMDAGLDTGPVYLQRAVPIDAGDDAGSLHDRLAVLGAEALLEVLDSIRSGSARPQAQPVDGVTYARKIEKREAFLDWRRPAQELERCIRAFRPAPGAAARLRGEALKIWRARIVPASASAGTVLRCEQALEVACGSDALAIDEVQAAGGRRMPAVEFLRGRDIAPGTRFDFQ